MLLYIYILNIIIRQYFLCKIRFAFLKPLFKGNFRGFVDGVRDEIDFKFLIPLILGIAVAFFTLSIVVSYCMDVYEAVTFSFWSRFWVGVYVPAVIP